MTTTDNPRLRTHGTYLGVAAIMLAAVAALLPGFAVGALAVPIQRDLGIASARFGLLSACFFAVSALASVLTRRIVPRLPVPAVLAGISGLSSVTLLAASRINGAGSLTVLMVLAGLGNALVQPAAGRFIASEVPPERLALATGLVGAALGAAPFVPGMLVALVAASHGWRAAVTVGGILALIVMLSAPLARAGSGADRQVRADPVAPDVDTAGQVTGSTIVALRCSDRGPHTHRPGDTR